MKDVLPIYSRFSKPSARSSHSFAICNSRSYVCLSLIEAARRRQRSAFRRRLLMASCDLAGVIGLSGILLLQRAVKGFDPRSARLCSYRGPRNQARNYYDPASQCAARTALRNSRDLALVFPIDRRTNRQQKPWWPLSVAIRVACEMLSDAKRQDAEVGPMVGEEPVLSGDELRRICAIIRGERP